MPRMTQPEYDAALAAAKFEGAQDTMHLVAGMTDLGLGLAAITGALRGHVTDLAERASVMRKAAEESRQEAPEPALD